MDNKSDWQSLRNGFIRATGDTPGGHLEDELIRAYAENPAAVERAVEKITVAYGAGKIRSPWGALKVEVSRAVDATRNPTHDQGSSKQKAIARAEQWMRTAGIHFDRPTEIEQALFGASPEEFDRFGEPITSPGSKILGAFVNDADLRRRMVSLWREVRATGEKLEAEQAKRAARARRVSA
jgi:hypothetical protein